MEDNSMMTESEESEVKAIEINMVRKQLAGYFRSMVPVFLLFFFLTVQRVSDELNHLRQPSIIIAFVAAFVLVSLKAVQKSRDAEIQKRALITENAFLVVRTVVHIICIIFQGGADTCFLKFFSLVILPISSSRDCKSVRSFKIYLLAHGLLNFYAFQDRWRECLPWIVGSLIGQTILLDLVSQLVAEKDTRAQLYRASTRLKLSAEAATTSAFSTFCDATFELDSYLRVTSSSEGAAALLRREVDELKTIHFPGLLSESQDMPRFTNVLYEIKDELSSGRKCASKVVKPLRMKLRKHDPVEVYLFPACFIGFDNAPKFILGVSQSWTLRGGNGGVRWASGSSESEYVDEVNGHSRESYARYRKR